MEPQQSKTPTHELFRLELSLLCSLIGMLGCDSYTEKVMMMGRLCSIPSWDDEFVRRFVENKLCDFKKIAMRHGFPEPWSLDNSTCSMSLFRVVRPFFYLSILYFYLINVYFRFLLEGIQSRDFTTYKWICLSSAFFIL